jgi:endonuclease-3
LAQGFGRAIFRSMPPRAKLSPAEKRRIQAIFEELARDRPDPKTELDYVPSKPFTLLVAVALSAQATDKSVNKATEALFKVADTPAKMAALGEDGLIPYIRTIGLYRTKAKNVIRTSHILIDRYGGQVPLEREALQGLPGVGRKTASVVLNELGVEPAIAVDTHVFRVSHRLKLSSGKTPDQVEAELMSKVPEQYLKTAHHLLILHGRYVCTARKPRCLECPVAQWCPSRDLFV